MEAGPARALTVSDMPAALANPEPLQQLLLQSLLSQCLSLPMLATLTILGESEPTSREA
jgi:hypothetical protein